MLFWLCWSLRFHPLCSLCNRRGRSRPPSSLYCESSERVKAGELLISPIGQQATSLFIRVTHANTNTNANTTPPSAPVLPLPLPPLLALSAPARVTSHSQTNWAVQGLQGARPGVSRRIVSSIGNWHSLHPSTSRTIIQRSTGQRSG